MYLLPPCLYIPCFSCIQNMLKREASLIEDFFRDGVSCRLPLDPAVCVKGLDVEVRLCCLSRLCNHPPLGVYSFDALPTGL